MILLTDIVTFFSNPLFCFWRQDNFSPFSQVCKAWSSRAYIEAILPIIQIFLQTYGAHFYTNPASKKYFLNKNFYCVLANTWLGLGGTYLTRGYSQRAPQYIPRNGLQFPRSATCKEDGPGVMAVGHRVQQLPLEVDTREKRHAVCCLQQEHNVEKGFQNVGLQPGSVSVFSVVSNNLKMFISVSQHSVSQLRHAGKFCS